MRSTATSVSWVVVSQARPCSLTSSIAVGISRNRSRLQAAGIDAEVEFEITHHGTPREIADVADHVGADAIVCGTRGLGGLFGLLTGSVAADLLRKATVPVIVVPAKVASKAPTAATDGPTTSRPTQPSSGEWTMTTLAPSDALPADVFCDNEGLIRIEVDVPGLQPTVDVRVRDHTVIVDGHRACEPSSHYLLHERARSFHREFELPDETDMRNVHARIHDGVLTISAPVGAGSTEAGEHRLEVLPSGWACHPDAAAI